jgi:hypothetical protein
VAAGEGLASGVGEGEVALDEAGVELVLRYENTVNEFLLRECGRVSAGSAKGRVAELRAVLRFLYLQGLTLLRLGTAMPPVGGWRRCRPR